MDQLTALLGHAQNTKAGLVINDATTLETVRIGNVERADLVQNVLARPHPRGWGRSMPARAGATPR